MKKIILLTICFAIAILGGCQNILTEKPNSSGKALPDGYGALKVSLSGGTARTAMPGIVLKNFELEFSFNGEKKQFAAPDDGKTYSFILKTGTYSLVVKAWEIGEIKTEENIVAEGTADIKIEPGKTINNVVALRPKESEKGVGSMTFTLNHDNNGITIAAFTLNPIFSDNPLIDLREWLSPDGSPFNQSMPITVKISNVPAGYYLLSMTLQKTDATVTNAFAGKSEVVHIYRGRDTPVKFDFTNVTFLENIVTNTLDNYEDGDGASIPGSLRYAVEKASGLGVKTIIKVMLPAGSEIKLKRVLDVNPSIGIVIEGNGITLTKSAEPWEGGPDRLMTTSSKVTISRVHFKDSPGGAIKNDGELNLESCIFSGNRAYDDGYSGSGGSGGSGGAIYNDGTLEIKGCTFYDNHAYESYPGGAIYNSWNQATVNLTGNLFFGNTAYYDNVISNNNVTDAITSGGYNVLYLDDTNDSFPLEEKDAAIPAPLQPPFSPKTFKLFKGSETLKRPFNLEPEKYLIKDFYGNDIKAPIYAGAVQEIIDKGYYLDLDSGHGSVITDPPSKDLIFTEGTTVTLRAKPLLKNSKLKGWLVNDVLKLDDGASSYKLTITDDIKIKAIFTVPVTTLDDNDYGSPTNMTLRYAILITEDGDEINFSPDLNITPLVSEIRLIKPLPEITNNITIEGSGITLTTVDSISDSMLKISGGNVKISRVLFKDGNLLGQQGGGTINNNGTLTLESCVFSDNTANDSSYGGGAIYNSGVLDLKSCTFYKNKASTKGGAIYNSYDGRLILTGNLFYGNEAPDSVIVYNDFGIIESKGYNVVNAGFGQNYNDCGWYNDTNNDQVIYDLTFSPKTFKLIKGTNVNGCIITMPTDYPKEDFYGQPIETKASAGAVQAIINSENDIYLELVFDTSRGNINYNNEEGLIQNDITLTAAAEDGYRFSYWMVGTDGPPIYLETLHLTNISSKYIEVQAVFEPYVTGAGDEDTPGTLRYALNNAKDGDTIRLSEAFTIELTGPLLIDNKSITIEGNGLTLNRALTWDEVNYGGASLLYIEGEHEDDKNVTIKRARLTNGSAYNGGAIYSRNTNLTIESCIFSDNTAKGNSGTGGAVYFNIDNSRSKKNLYVRGCTFLNNHSDYWGGVIFIYNGSIELTGNLFYNNTAATRHAILGTSLSDIISTTYNAVDRDFGTGNTSIGWTQGTGDIQYTGVPINTTTFKPELSALSSIIPYPPPTNFPTTDFYGKTRNFPEAPGAVNYKD
jgi:predicted outer membrane repeat protein